MNNLFHMFKSRKAKSNAMNHASPLLLILRDQALSRNIVLDIYWICLPRIVSSIMTVGTSIPTYKLRCNVTWCLSTIKNYCSILYRIFLYFLLGGWRYPPCTLRVPTPALPTRPAASFFSPLHLTPSTSRLS